MQTAFLVLINIIMPWLAPLPAYEIAYLSLAFSLCKSWVYSIRI